MSESSKDLKRGDEVRFNETVQRMLKTPPKPHGDQIKKGGDKAPPPSQTKENPLPSDFVVSP
jgi:hypothetical protein